VKLRTRLLLFGAVIPTLLLVAGSVVAGLVFERAMLAEHDQALLGQGAVEAVSLFDRAAAPHLHLGESPLASQVREHPPQGALYGPDGERITAYPHDADVPVRLLPSSVTYEATLHTEDAAAGRRRVLRLRVDDPRGRPFALWLSAPLERHDREMEAYWRISSLVLAVVAALVLLAQLVHARRLARRVGNLGEHMRQLRVGRLDVRPAADPVGDEIAELRDAIAETTVQLEAARHAQDRLVADAAHELRTPLASMRAGIDVALRRERSPAELRQTLEDVRHEVDRLADLATRLLDLAALRASPLERRPGDLVPTLIEAVDAARAAAEPRGVLVELDAPARAPAEHAAVAVRQALDNLLANAIKFSPTGGRVEVALRQEQGGWCFTVGDHGPGVSVAEREAIFEPFHRTAHDVPGTGLGLAIVHDVAVRHGGRTWVEAGEGGGARFHLRLPGHGRSSATTSRTMHRSATAAAAPRPHGPCTPRDP
jgi:signal transduction histidine kinase